MKKQAFIRFLIFSAIVCLLFSSCATLKTPDVPLPAWTDGFDDRDPRWNTGDWTFDQNLCRFDREHAAFSNGMLTLTISKAGTNSDRPYRSAEVFTSEEYKYGVFTARMKPNSPSGVVTSFFLLHIDFDKDWKALEWYEIDIEFPGRTDIVSYALHWMKDGEMRHTGKEVSPGIDLGKDFHDFTIDWTRGSIIFLIDGKESCRFDDPAVMEELRHPMSLHMNYWVSESKDGSDPSCPRSSRSRQNTIQSPTPPENRDSTLFGQSTTAFSHVNSIY